MTESGETRVLIDTESGSDLALESANEKPLVDSDAGHLAVGSGNKRPLVDTVASHDLTGVRGNEYSGFQPSLGITHLTDRVSAAIDPVEFFNQYIKSRQPTIITGLLDDKEHWHVQHWSNEYLINKAGSSKVFLENWKDGDASNDMVEVKYQQLVEGIAAGDSKFHLTTLDTPVCSSELDSNDDVIPATIVEPLPMLLDDFPCRPALIGNLVPRRIALCQGLSANPDGLSSGVRHDFHDRFCLAMRGRQRFRLFPPSAASQFLITGCPIKVYNNGLIVYLPKRTKKLSSRDIKVRADGAPFESVARQKRDDADANLVKAEKKLYHLRRSGVSRTELEKAMDQVNECENVVDTANEELHRLLNFNYINLYC